MNINGKEYVLADGKQQELIKKLEKENEKLKDALYCFVYLKNRVKTMLSYLL